LFGVLTVANEQKISGDIFNLLSWYKQVGRVLPWRSFWPNLSPAYHVFLSEFMLQQTGVRTVIPYFQRFLERWPTIDDLADASIDDVTEAWAGLGYYARARNLHKSAQIISKAGGAFPQSIKELTNLPGIGPYTAGAITAIAFDKSSVVIDGNIERIIARYFGLKTSLPSLKAELPPYYEKMIPERNRSDFPQALMDLGNEICTALSPNCKNCPINRGCISAKSENPGLLPNRPLKRTKPIRKGQIFVLRYKSDNDNKYLVYRRPVKGLLGGLLAFPSIGWDDKLQHFDVDWRPFSVNWMELKPSIRHVFTHFNAEIKVFLSEAKTTDSEIWKQKFQSGNETIAKKQKLPEFHWKAEVDLHLPKLMQKALTLTSSK